VCFVVCSIDLAVVVVVVVALVVAGPGEGVVEAWAELLVVVYRGTIPPVSLLLWLRLELEELSLLKRNNHMGGLLTTWEVYSHTALCSHWCVRRCCDVIGDDSCCAHALQFVLSHVWVSPHVYVCSMINNDGGCKGGVTTLRSPALRNNYALRNNEYDFVRDR
jgi:hypothetical protein